MTAHISNTRKEDAEVSRLSRAWLRYMRRVYDSAGVNLHFAIYAQIHVAFLIIRQSRPPRTVISELNTEPASFPCLRFPTSSRSVKARLGATAVR